MERKKQFKLAAEQLKQLVPEMGSCLASDRITVDGCKVGYMYREWADTGLDCGWRFMAGNESQEYLDNADNIEVYAVNTIANYDPDIIMFLSSGIGAAFDRDEGGKLGQLRPATALGAHTFPDDVDGDVLRRLQVHADFSQPMSVDFQVIFRGEQEAREFANFMKPRSMVEAVTVEAIPADHQDGFRWDVTVVYSMYVSRASIQYEEGKLAKHAAKFGGEMDGWGSFGNLQDRK